MKINVKKFVYDDYHSFSANTYILSDENNNCFIVDPGIDDNNVIKYIDDNNLNLLGVLLTHGHFDHIRGLNLLLKKYPSMNIYIHTEDEICLNDPAYNASNMDNKLFAIDVKPIIINENDIIKGLSEDIFILHTPFHTMGSVCYYLKDSKLFFAGDTLFKMSIGRFDLVNSSFRLIKPSLNKIRQLDDDYIVFSGHGENTTIGYEKKNNPYLR